MRSNYNCKRQTGKQDKALDPPEADKLQWGGKNVCGTQTKFSGAATKTATPAELSLT
jgi:hypothetical protein